MKNKIPTLDDFEMVESIVKHKSIRSASGKLGVSPSSLSRKLSLLEVKLESNIFKRDTRNISLTEFGKKFVQAAEIITDTTEKIMNSFNSQLSSSLGQLTVAALPHITCTLLPQLVVDFIEKHTEINLNIYDLTSSEIIEALENGSVDIGITDETPHLRNKMSFVSLFEFEHIIVCSKNDPLLTKKSYTLEEIIEFPIISPRKGTGVRELVESEFNRQNLEYVPRIEASHISTSMAMVAEGLGIMIASKLILPAFETEKYKFSKIKNSDIIRKIGVAYQSGKALTPIAESFTKHVRKEIKPLYRSIIKDI